MTAEEPPRPAFRDYLQRMNLLGFKPSKRLGQNFLLDAELHRRIIDAADPAPADAALEVGAGLGFLTRELAGRCRRLVAVEIDPRLLRILQEDVPTYPEGDRVTLVHCNALGGPGGTLHPDILAAVAKAVGEQPLGERPPGEQGDLRVIANLPYAVSGPLLVELSVLEPLPAAMSVLVQKELAQRLAAPPGHRDRGSLSVLMQCLFEVRLERTVGPGVFRPRPQVDSAICSLRADASAPLASADGATRRAAAQLIRGLFQQRRKRIQGVAAAAVAAVGIEDAVERVAAWPEAIRMARPQELTMGDWSRILEELPDTGGAGFGSIHGGTS